jgi:hypothetical protein
VTTVLPDIPESLLYKQSFIEKTLLGSRVHDCADTINNYYMTHDRVIPCEDAYKSEKFQKEDGPYIKGYLKFLKEKKPVILSSEQKMYHKLYNYAGTLDLAVEMKGKLSILDIKTSTKVAPYARLQLAAYIRVWNAKYPNNEIFNRGVIHLLPNGTYKLVTYPVKDLRNDTEIFLCKLRSAQWDIANGVSK